MNTNVFSRKPFNDVNCQVHQMSSIYTTPTMLCYDFNQCRLKSTFLKYTSPTANTKLMLSQSCKMKSTLQDKKCWGIHSYLSLYSKDLSPPDPSEARLHFPLNLLHFPLLITPSLSLERGWNVLQYKNTPALVFRRSYT